MRVSTLLGTFLLAACVWCSASDQAATPAPSWLVVPMGRSGLAFIPKQNDQSIPLSIRNRIRIDRSADSGCLMLRTYIMVREDPDSDVTRRDGYKICQPAWKFEIRKAIGKTEDR